jgi:hypothetical protein
MKVEGQSGSEVIVRALLCVAQELDDGALASASAEARSEWSALLGRLPTEADLRRGIVKFPEDELRQLLGKAVRFREILRVEAPAFPRSA